MSSDEDSNASEEVELESSDEEVISGDDSDQADGSDRGIEDADISEDAESVVSVESHALSQEGTGEMHKMEKMREEEGDDDVQSVISADDPSDDDSVSLNSMDTVEAENAARVKKEEAEAVRDRDFSSLYLPVGGIFDHKLIRGLPVDPDEFKRQQQAFFNGETAAERTTTRNTPANVIEALDQELRFARPPVTSDILVAKYNVIKLVIKRRIDHLRARGLTTPGIRYDHSFSTTNYEAGPSQTADANDKLLYDIQFRNPPMTVKDMSILYNMSVHALHAKIYALRNKGVVTSGICASTNGRGRPRKTENESMEEAEANPDTPNNNSSAYFTNKATNSSRVLRYFTEEEDQYLTCAVLECLEWSKDVGWGNLDAKMNRSRGATKQRWHKTLEKRVGSQIQNSLRLRLHHVYKWQSRPLREDDDNNSETGIQATVKDTLNCLVGAVSEFSNKFPHHIVTLPLSYPTDHPTWSTTLNTATAIIPSYSKSSRAIIPTPAALQQHLHTSNHSGQRRAFTEQEDNLIISTALHNRQLGVGRFWNALDEQLQRYEIVVGCICVYPLDMYKPKLSLRLFCFSCIFCFMPITFLSMCYFRPKLAARGRWQRVLEPMVQERIAMMAENKSEAITTTGPDSNEGSGSTTGNVDADGSADKNGSADVSDGVMMNNETDIHGTAETSIVKNNVDDSGETMDVVEQAAVDTIVHMVAEEGPPADFRNTIDTSPTHTVLHTTTIIKNELLAITTTEDVYDSHTYAPQTSSTNSHSRSFSAAEDDLIRTTVTDWIGTGNGLHELSWRQLDAQLKRPPFSALVRYLTVLQPQPPSTGKPANGQSIRKVIVDLQQTPKPSVGSLPSLYNTFRAAYKAPTRTNDEIRLEVKTTVDCMIMAIMHRAGGNRPSVAHIPSVTHNPKKPFLSTATVEKDDVNHNRCKRFSPEEDEFVKSWIENAKAAGTIACTLCWLCSSVFTKAFISTFNILNPC